MSKFLIVLIIYFISLVSLSIAYRMKIRELKSSAFSTKENNIIKDILDLSISKESILTLGESALAIVKTLTSYYRLDYCTILINQGRLINIASNVDKEYVSHIERHCNQVLSEMSGAAKINYSEKGLKYYSAFEREIKYSYLIPLQNQCKSIGAIFIENKEDYKENQFELEFFKIVIKNITISIQNCIYHDQISSMAMRDNLTKIYNRNYMQIHLQQQIELNNNFALALLDIDYFKKFNDTYGHEFGDIVLVEVSNFIKNHIRECDEIYRWGGEEFVIFFYNISSKEIFERLNEIREKLSKYIIKNEKNIETNVAASFGLCDHPRDGDSINELLANADKALYYSKANGRNRITIYEDIL